MIRILQKHWNVRFSPMDFIITATKL